MTPDEINAANEELVRSYRLAFGSPAGQEVLRDLIIFCRPNYTTFGDPQLPMKILEGRRQVFLHIQNRVSLEPGELVLLARGHSIRQQGA